MSAPLKRGDRVGKDQYKIMSQIGHGGFGDVFLADSGTGLVAIKVVDTSVWSKKEYRVFNAMMVSEAAFLSTLEHRLLPKLSAFFAEGSRYFLVMDWVKGETLEELVQRQGPLPVEEALELLSSILEVLEYLHDQCEPTVVFGDIKPANVLRANDGAYRLVDLGLATRLGTRLTGTFAVFSPDYSAPERAQGEGSCIGHDVFALAATFVYAVTGSAPGRSNGPRAIRHVFRKGAAQWSEASRSALAAIYPELVRCLHEDAAERSSDTKGLRRTVAHWATVWQKEDDSNVSAIMDSLYSGEKKPKL